MCIRDRYQALLPTGYLFVAVEFTELPQRAWRFADRLDEDDHGSSTASSELFVEVVDGALRVSTEFENPEPAKHSGIAWEW